jgi:hypothetical protein
MPCAYYIVIGVLAASILGAGLMAKLTQQEA